jgi:hypothetical protein
MKFRASDGWKQQRTEYEISQSSLHAVVVTKKKKNENRDERVTDCH